MGGGIPQIPSPGVYFGSGRQGADSSGRRCLRRAARLGDAGRLSCACQIHKIFWVKSCLPGCPRSGKGCSPKSLGGHAVTLHGGRPTPLLPRAGSSLPPEFASSLVAGQASHTQAAGGDWARPTRSVGTQGPRRGAGRWAPWTAPDRAGPERWRPSPCRWGGIITGAITDATLKQAGYRYTAPRGSNPASAGKDRSGSMGRRPSRQKAAIGGLAGH